MDISDDEQLRTPKGVRLAEYRGPVARVVQLLEYHVHDVPRLIAAAAADGWEPLEPEDDDQDPRDVAGAVMFMARPPDVGPGVDLITDSMVACLLRTDHGDEVADWSPVPVSADFGIGHRVAQVSPSQGPDFAALFPVTDCSCEPEECEHWEITPRTADALYVSLGVLADEAYDDVEEHGDAPVGEDGSWNVFDRLPKITWTCDRSWRRQFARACDDLAEDLAHGEWPIPRTTAEEMALHLAIEDAPVWLDGNDMVGDHGNLPARRDDYDWDCCSEVLFQDNDVLLLFDDDMAGIESTANIVNRALGIGHGLHPTDWYSPFNSGKPARDPGRGFRR